jgi:1-acyl-sn-glycerol-3-phosphate acyltransferase
MGASGLKETLRRLRRGGMVLLFPEGTRSCDGQLQPVKPGIAVLAAKAKVPVVPVGIAGAFEAWPRNQRFPRLGTIRVAFGAPLFPADLAGLSSLEVTELIHQRLADCHERACSDLVVRAGHR